MTKMINPDSITNFNQTPEQLQEFMSFWVLVFGKTAHVIAPTLERMMTFGRSRGINNAFDLWLDVGKKKLPEFLRKNGVGCFTVKGAGLYQLAKSGINLQTCTLDDLADFPGQGQKTRRCFLIHSRPDQKLAGLDTQILKLLREVYGYTDAPAVTPASERGYKKWEGVVVDIFTREGRTAAEFDLNGWKMFRRAIKGILVTEDVQAA